MVGSEGVALFGPTARGIEREAAISWEVPNFDEQLVEALGEQNRGDPVLILFDGADQTYRKEENIPKLSSFDRARYIKRKLDQAFPSYPVRASTLIKPKDENPFYLFVALPETDRLDRIADDMLEAGVPISGFGLLPAESVGLVSALSAKVFGGGVRKSGWAVLIDQHETGGLRQVVVKNGNLALTRITPTSEAGVHGPGWADEVMREFRATLTYIARFGYTAEEGLDVIVICGNIEKQFFNDKSLPVTNFRCLTTMEALEAVGAKGVSLGETNFGDAIHALWAARKTKLSIPITVPSLHRIMVPRTVARVASIFLAFAFVGLCYFTYDSYSDYLLTKDRIGDLQRQHDLLEQDYARESVAFDAYPVKPDVIKGVMNVKKMVDTSGVNITPTLNVLRRALASDIKLSSLYFSHDAKPIFDAFAKSGTPTPEAEKERGAVTIKFRFTLPGNIDLERKVQRAEALVEKLKLDFPGYQVRIASQFGNVSRTGKYEGEAGSKTQSPDKQGESAEIEMKGPPLL